MADLLVDTDVFIDHLRGARRFEPSADRIWYSVVTRCELFAGSRVDEAGVRVLLAPFRESAVDRIMGERAGRLRRETGLRIADALIAATALELGLVLLTRNVRDFARISTLTLLTPDQRDNM